MSVRNKYARVSHPTQFYICRKNIVNAASATVLKKNQKTPSVWDYYS